jgi:hypothetical protein
MLMMMMVMVRRRRRRMKHLNCLMSHYEMNLSYVQNTISSCDPTAKLKFKKNCN